MENSSKVSRDMPVPPEIAQLIHRSLDGPVSADEVLRIQQALADSSDARDWYSEVAQLHADLTSVKKSFDLCRQVQIECAEGTDEPATVADRASQNLAHFVSRLQPFPLGLAASLLVLGIGLGCGVGLFAATVAYLPAKFVVAPWNWKVGNDVVARIVSTDDIEWQSAESPETLPTQGLREGQQLRIERGFLHLRYRSGKDVILVGPAVYEIRNEHGGKLYYGRLSATCSSGSTTLHVDTPVGVLHMGPGQYGLEVARDESGRVADSTTALVYVMDGMVPGETNARFTDLSGDSTDLNSGLAMRFSNNAPPEYLEQVGLDRFPLEMPSPKRQAFESTEILLGNLFDDSKTSSLSDAMASDAFQAAGETIDLGVATVHDGGLDVDVLLAEEGVVFSFANIGGGGPKVRGLPSNDSYRSTHSVPIRTTGKDFLGLGPQHKVEEGIGMCTNELITFDLKELREAGNLGDVQMRFVVDRAGINDRDSEDLVAPYKEIAKVHMVAVVSTTDRVLSAHVNGDPLEVVDRGGVYYVERNPDTDLRPLRYDGRYATFDVIIPPEARFLTLATTMVGKEDCDHAVFSGARLELMPKPEPESDDDA